MIISNHDQSKPVGKVVFEKGKVIFEILPGAKVKKEYIQNLWPTYRIIEEKDGLVTKAELIGFRFNGHIEVEGNDQKAND